MHCLRRLKSRLAILAVFGILACCLAAAGQETASAGPAKLTREQMENFLRNGKIGDRKNLSTGVTNSQRATIEHNGVRHEAHIQTVEISKTSFQTQRGTELNFRDSFKYNMAGYELDKLLGLNMVPPSVERKVGSQSAAVTWWVDDVAMTELERTRNKTSPPDLDNWNKQMYVVRVFDQLIYNTDRNLGNLVITRDWQIWMIDHTRAFRMMKKLENPKNLVQIERRLLARLRELNKDELKQRLGKYLTNMEREAILGRRDEIVKLFDEEIKKKGEAAVVYELPARS